ncbi:MAG: glycosyltransferase [Anaerolineales bacterium]|nr:glycosyltransferase [Anaerolineales bacterium]
MHVAIVTTHPPGKGSLNEYAYHFVRALRQKPDVDQVTLLVDALPDGESYPELEQGAGLAPVTMTPCWRFDDVRNADRILAATRRARPDVVLFNLQFATFGGGKVTASVGLTAPKMVSMAGFPTIVLLHNIMETVDLRKAGYASQPLMEALIRNVGNVVTRMVLSVDRVAVTIPKYVEILRDKYHADNVLLAPHGSFEEAPPVPDFDLPPGPKQIMAFGKFGTYKTVEILLDALTLLEAQGRTDLEVVIAGTDSPNAKGYLQSVRERYAHLPNVRFTGYVAEEDVPRIFTEAAVVVFPYTSTTGSSGVLHQAGSYGKAVVLPRIGDFAEVITEEGYDGEFFAPDDIGALAQAIANLLDNDERRREMGMNNYMAACGLPISDVVDWYLLHFEEIIAERRNGKKSKAAPAPEMSAPAASLNP